MRANATPYSRFRRVNELAQSPPCLKPALLQYNRAELTALNVSSRVSLPPNVSTDVPKRRKRGRKGGVRERSRRMKFGTPLPTMVMGNTQSMRNKMDELEACVHFNSEYRESAMIGLSETWLDENVTDTEINLPGFTCIRGDRTSASGKRHSGGVGLFINERWCNNATASAKVCLPDIEFLTVSVRPFYLPREFPNIYLRMVYCHPKANVDNACSVLTNHIHELEKNFPDVPIIIFIECRLNASLPNFHKFVNVPTRKTEHLINATVT